MWAALNGLAEFGGGALLVLGLITPLGSAAVAGVIRGTGFRRRV